MVLLGDVFPQKTLLQLMLLWAAICGLATEDVVTPGAIVAPAPMAGEIYEQAARNHMCNAQCDAFCYENRLQCGRYCDTNATRRWIFQCNETDQIMQIGYLYLQPEFRVILSNCPGTCSVLRDIGPGYVPPKPQLVLERDGRGRSVTVGWSVPTTNHSIMYVVEESHLHQNERMTNVHLVLGDQYTHTNIEDVCTKFTYRVAAVSQYGSCWFTDEISTPDLVPEVPADFRASNVVYDNRTQEFRYSLQWSTPRGWWTTDVLLYRTNYDIVCPPTLDPVFVFTDDAQRDGDTYTMQIRIPENGVGCTVTHAICAVSRCREDLASFWEYVKIDLTCAHIKDIYDGQHCVPLPFSPPGNIRSVQTHVVQSPYGPQTYVSWTPPTDLGSAGVVGSYVIFYGLLDDFRIGFVRNSHHNITVPGNVHNAVVPALKYGAGGTFGVMVMAAAPGQVIDQPIGIVFPVEVPDFEGDILMTEDDMAVVAYPANKTVRVYWKPQDDTKQTDVRGVALQWGRLKRQDVPLLTDDGNNATGDGQAQEDQGHYHNLNDTDFDVENAAIVEKNATFYEMNDIKQSGLYGIKMVMLSGLWDDPSLIAPSDWQAARTYVFKIPETFVDSAGTSKADAVTSSSAMPAASQTPALAAAITIPLVLALSVVVGVMLWARLRRREKFAHLMKLQGPEFRVYTYFLPRQQDDNGADSVNVVADEWELPPSCLRVGRELGSGAFGQVLIGRVSRAMLHHRGLPEGYLAAYVQGARQRGLQSEGDNMLVPVAIKMLKDGCGESNKAEFLREIRLMKELGHHPHVVSMLGCCTLREPYCLLVEHVPNGDLLRFLKAIRHNLTTSSEGGRAYENVDVGHMTSKDILSFGRQIALGMEFLSGKGFVHRDLAARNILVGHNNHVKIGDFGLARYVYTDKIYVNRKGGKLPLKWMAVESIFDLTFSTYSDVWSFGVVLFEIVTLGGTPYPTHSVCDLLRALKSGYRMERPDNCSAEIYRIMGACWREVPSERPTFSALRQSIEELLSDSSGTQYMNMAVDANKDYYNCSSDVSDPDLDPDPDVPALEEDSALTSPDSCRREDGKDPEESKDCEEFSEAENSRVEGMGSGNAPETGMKFVSVSVHNRFDQSDSAADCSSTAETGSHHQGVKEKESCCSDGEGKLQTERQKDFRGKSAEANGENDRDGEDGDEGVDDKVRQVSPRSSPSAAGPEAAWDDVFAEDSDWEAAASPTQKRCLDSALRGDCHPRKLLAVPCFLPQSAAVSQLHALASRSMSLRLGSCGDSVCTSSSSGESIGLYLPTVSQGVTFCDPPLSAASLPVSLSQRRHARHPGPQQQQLQPIYQRHHSQTAPSTASAGRQTPGSRRAKVYSRSGGDTTATVPS